MFKHRLLALLLLSCSAPPTTGDSGTGGGGIIAAGGSSGVGGGAAGGSGGGSTGGGSGEDAGIDAGAGTGDAGTRCDEPGDCASGSCIAWFRDAGAVCGRRCLTQQACADLPGFTCIPDSTGEGWCVPKSPAHCLPCEFTEDCGALTEACVLAPGETAMTCRVDCSLAGADACPPDYVCTELRFNNQQRSFCMPPMGSCLTAAGGFCDRFSTPQPCSNTNDAGTCTGERACVNGRFTACTAQTAACRSCEDPVRPACTEPLCEGATSSPQHCGTCGNACPGAGSTTANVTCADGGCTFSCKGENYDVNSMQADGCEVVDSPTGNHLDTTPTSLGNLPCNDGSSTINVSGRVPSDTRVHTNPALPGYVTAQGAAKDFFAINATGGTCVNDIDVTLTVTQAAMPSCYRLTIVTDQASRTCTPSGGNTCRISSGSGSYSDDTVISLVVERTCSAAGANASYTLAGHF